MANLLQIIKLKAFLSLINSLDEEKMVDIIEDIAKKQFGNDYKKSLMKLQYKFASVTFVLGRRAK